MKAFDSEAPEALLGRLGERGGLPADALGCLAQTRHHELAAQDDRDAEAWWAVAREASRRSPPRMQRLRLVTITTDSPGSFAAWLRSLRGALDDAGWAIASGPVVEVLRVANDSDASVEASHEVVAEKGIKLHVARIDPRRRPLPLAEVRPFAFRCVRELGWVPSPSAPVWSLDEDFRFDTLVPSPRSMFVRRSGGPLLHRLDVLVARLAAEHVDVVIGGNSGAAPVPALGLLLGQLRDLAVDGADGPASSLALQHLSQLPDAYYDLTDQPADALRVPLTRAWWSSAGLDWGEIVRRLEAGLPVTRPALAMPLQRAGGAWATYGHTGVAGGNTLLLSPRALDARFAHVQHGTLTSRRADTTWAIDARAQHANIVRACLPLFHDRQRGPQGPVGAAREALADSLGVGVYRSLLAGDTTEAGVLARAEARLVALRTHLVAAEAEARRLRTDCRTAQAFADWVAEAREALRFERARPLQFKWSSNP